MEDAYRIADDAEENEGADCARQVNRRERSSIVGEHPAPERADAGSVDGASPARGRFNQQRADAAEATGFVPLHRRFAVRLHRASRIARALAWAWGASTAPLEP